MPVVSKLCDRGSKTGKAAVSWVSISSPVVRLRPIRKVPCIQLTIEKSWAEVRSRNRINSSLGANRGTPETVDVKFPAWPPRRRTVIWAGADPFQVSSTSKVVKVQISPASQRVELATHRARMTVWAARDKSATDMRLSVVARVGG